MSRLTIGVIVAPHGIRGELRMRIWTHYPERIPTLSHVFLGDEEQPRRLRRARLSDKGVILRLEGVTSREEAEALRGTVVKIGLEQAAPLEEGEYYHFQLIGLRVEDEAGTLLGELADIIETGANDVYVVRGEGGAETLVPALERHVLDVDLDAGRMTVRLPDYAN